MRHHLTPIEWLSSINQHTAGAGEDGRKGPSCTAGGNADGAAAVESSMRFLKTLEILLWVSGHHTATRGNMARRAGALVHMDQSAGLGTPPASAWPQEGPPGLGEGLHAGHGGAQASGRAAGLKWEGRPRGRESRGWVPGGEGGGGRRGLELPSLCLRRGEAELRRKGSIPRASRMPPPWAPSLLLTHRGQAQVAPCSHLPPPTPGPSEAPPSRCAAGRGEASPGPCLPPSGWFLSPLQLQPALSAAGWLLSRERAPLPPTANSTSGKATSGPAGHSGCPLSLRCSQRAGCLGCCAPARGLLLGGEPGDLGVSVSKGPHNAVQGTDTAGRKSRHPEENAL